MYCFIMLFLASICTFFFSCSGGEESHTHGKIVFIALDGADWDVIQPLIDDGILPNFHKLMKEGTRANLLSLGKEWVFSPEEMKWGTSPAIWTSAATGKLPEEHGIVNFIVSDGSVTFPITSNYLRATPMWDIMSRKGLKVAVVGWWATWPAKPVNGFMVSDHVGISRWDLTTNYNKSGLVLHGDTYPSSLLEEIAPFRRSPSDISTAEAMNICNIDSMIGDLLAGHRLYELKIALAADFTYTRISLYLMDEYDLDFITPYIEGIDIVQHLFWKYMDPDTAVFDVGERDVRNLGDVIRSYHVLADSILGEFLKRKGEKDWIIIASDHGFMPSNVRNNIHISGEHDRTGILLMSGPGIKKGHVIDEVDILDLAPMVLYIEDIPIARDMRGTIPLSAFTGEFKRQRQVEYVDTYESRGEDLSEISPIPSPVDSDLLEKLEALGYISRDHGSD